MTGDVVLVGIVEYPPLNKKSAIARLQLDSEKKWSTIV